MIKSILILTPSPLVSQWKEEMETKFGIEFMTTEEAWMPNDPEGFWKGNSRKEQKTSSLYSSNCYGCTCES
jgi:hypothetical protein